MRSRLIAVALVACAVTASCGSTVPAAQRSRVSGASGEGALLDAGSDTGVGEAVAGTAASDATGRGGTAARSSTPRSNTSSGSASANKTSGVKQSSVVIGYQYPNDPGPVVQALHLSGVSTGDQKGYAQAVVNAINKAGGVNGRKIEVVWHEFNSANATANLAAEEQATCAAFTEDNHVFAVLSPVLTGSIVFQCLAERGVGLVDANYNFFDMADQGLHAHHFSPSYPTTPRGYAAFVDVLVSRSFFPRGAKIGAAYQDSAPRKLAFDAVVKGLSAHGLRMDDSFAYTTPDQISGGMLKFKAEGITHMFLIDGSGGLETLVTMQQAESQGYRPKYALNTLSGPDLLQANAPRAQLAGAAGMGWIPVVDIGKLENSARDKECLATLRGAGLDVPDNTAGRFALAACDIITFFSDAMKRAPAFTIDGFRAGGEALGTAYMPFGSIASRFGPGRHDGPSVARYLQFDQGCSCFVYSGEPIDIG
jgi:ABC-type branched-subunit amino acid transport system substrate-binding protein